MRLDIISNDFELANAFRELHFFNVRSVAEDDINNSDCDVLVVSNKLVNINKLITIKSNNTICFYLSNHEDLSYIEKIDKSILEIKGVYIVPPKRSINQIKEIIIGQLFNSRQDNNVFTFFGCDSKVGTTSIAQSAAISLSKRYKTKNILMLFLDGHPGFDWVNSTGTRNSLSDIKVALKNNFLTIQGLKENCYRYAPNLYFLKGEDSLEENVYYHQNEINALIDLCKENFDFIIIDAGNVNNVNLRMTYSALTSSDNKILITDQMPKSYEMFRRAKLQVLESLKICDFKFIALNKFIRNSMLPKQEDIADRYMLPVISVLPFLDFCFQAAVEKNIEIFETEKAYRLGISSIVNYIEKKSGIESSIACKKSIFSFIRR